jgi:hypothetical protein
MHETSTDKAKISLYADGTTVIASNSSSQDFNVNKIFVDINDWLKMNLLSLNFKKHFIYNLRLQIV